MAYALLTHTNAVSAVSTTTITITPTVDIPIGSLIVIGWCCATASRTGTATDTGSDGATNVYTYFEAGAGATLSGGFLWSYTTSDLILANFDTITLSLSSSTTDVSVNMLVFSGASAQTQLDTFFAVNTKTTSPITMGASPAITESGSLAVAFTGWKGGNVANGFSATSSGYTGVTGLRGGTTTSVQCDSSYNPSVGTAATTSVHTFTSMTAGFGMLLVFRPNATLPNLTLLSDFTGAATNLTALTGFGTSVITSGDFSMKTDGSTNAVTTNGTPASGSWGTQFTADQEAGVTITTMDSHRIYTRMNTVSSPVSTGYRASIGFNGVLTIDTAAGSTKLTVTLGSPGTLPAMDWAMQSLGTQQTIWQRTPKSTGPWRALASIADATTNAAGFVGIQAPSGDTPSIDKLYGDSIASGPAFVAEYLAQRTSRPALMTAQIDAGIS